MFLTATWKYFACLHLKSLPLNGQYELPILGSISYTWLASKSLDAYRL